LDSTTDTEVHERRLALALDVDTSSRVLAINDTRSSKSANHSPNYAQISGPTIWKDGQWIKEGATATPKKIQRNKRVISTVPFRDLDAPSLRDDYYCSPLAYSATAECLAVGLGRHVFLWSENWGVNTLDYLNAPYIAHVTSLSFSSAEGGKGILAIGRACGRLLLWSPSEIHPRFTSIHWNSVCCVSFRPNTVKRPSRRDRYLTVETEELLVGDEAGHVFFYSVEWPTLEQYYIFGFLGDLTLLCRITVHNQQICGLAWSPDGDFFASGGNDNTCHLFETRRVLRHALADINNRNPPAPTTPATPGLRTINITASSPAFNLGHTIARHQWTVQAAVKAIAFCPWQRGLIAIGGGSNDRCIHFYHVLSGSNLATIDCNAQVTSLIWSTTRREIAATFGFAQPQHPYRIAVFSWPKCEVVVRIPWFEGHRALFAIPYPRGPDIGQARGEDGTWWSRTQEEGCIVVATSNESIKFHEVWAHKRKAVGSKRGVLGGCDILEAMHGIEKGRSEVIR
jgi:WD40 repeat protein